MGLVAPAPATPGAPLERELADAALCVDALLGTGARGAPRGALAALIEAVNATRLARARPTVALDLPSGLDADTGRAPGACIAADLTLTVAAPKLGFRAPEAAPLLGRVELVGIGAPPELAERVLRARGRAGDA
jgi:NAD(P)H-hydrate epimerase